MKKGSTKYKISPNGKRKLDFQQKHKKPSVKLPLIGKTVFLDVKEVKHQKRLLVDLKKLGATIEEFVSKDINYFITTQTRARPKKDVGDASPAPSPFNCDPSPSPGNMDEPKVPTVTRGKALAQRARVNSRETNSLLDNAEKWGVKIVSLETAYKWIDKELKKLPKSLHSNEKVPQYPKSIGSYKMLKAPFLKFESINLFYKPVTENLQDWPVVSVSTPRGSCPFDGFLLRGDDKSKEERGDLAAQVDIPTEDTPQEEKDGMDSNTPKPSATEKCTKKSETESFNSSRVLTMGELRRKKEQRRRQERKKGYCECCKTKYEDLDKHVREERHRLYVKDKSHYHQLDSLIGSVPSTAVFLKRCILASVTHTNVTDLSNSSKSEAIRKSPRKGRSIRDSPAGPKPAISKQHNDSRDENEPESLQTTGPGQRKSPRKCPTPVKNSVSMLGMNSPQEIQISSEFGSDSKENKPINARKSPRKLSKPTEHVGVTAFKSPRKPQPALKHLNDDHDSDTKDTRVVDQRKSPRKIGQNIERVGIKSPRKLITSLASPQSPLRSIRQSPRNTSYPFKTSNVEDEDLMISETVLKETHAQINALNTASTSNEININNSNQSNTNVSSSSEKDFDDVEESPSESKSDEVSNEQSGESDSKLKGIQEVKDQGYDSESGTTNTNDHAGSLLRPKRSEAGTVHKEIESLLSYSKDRVSRSGSSDDFEVSIFRSIDEVNRIVKAETDKDTEEEQSGMTEEEEVLLEMDTDHEGGDNHKTDSDGDTSESMIKRRLRQSPRKRSSQKDSLSEVHAPRQIATDIASKKRVEDKSSAIDSAVMNSYDRVTSDIPSDFQCYGPQGEFFMFSKTLAERIKERGSRRGSVENYNENIIRARSDSFSSTVSGGKVEKPVNVSKKPVNVSKKPSPKPGKKSGTSALVASKRICNKYRNKRNTNNERQVALSGYQGDDERELKQDKPKPMIGKKKSGKKFWYYEVESEENNAACDDEKLKSLPKLVQSLQTAWNDVTESSDNGGRKTRRSAVNASGNEVESKNQTEFGNDQHMSDIADKDDDGRTGEDYTKQLQSETSNTDRIKVPRSTTRKEMISKMNARRSLRQSNNIDSNDSDNSDVCGRTVRRGSLRSQTLESQASVRRTPRISYAPYFQNGFSSDSELSNLSEYKVSEANLDKGVCNNNEHEAVKDINDMDNVEADMTNCVDKTNRKTSNVRKKKFWEYVTVVEDESDESDGDDECIPKELRELKKTWSKLTDVNSRDSCRRSRSRSTDVRPNQEDNVEKANHENTIEKIQNDRLHETHLSMESRDNLKPKRKEKKFWEYVPITSPDKHVDDTADKVHGALRGLDPKNIVREGRKSSVKLYSDNINLITSEKAKIDLYSFKQHTKSYDNLKQDKSERSFPTPSLENKTHNKIAVESASTSENENISEKNNRIVSQDDVDIVSSNKLHNKDKDGEKKTEKKKKQFWHYIPIVSPDKGKESNQHGMPKNEQHNKDKDGEKKKEKKRKQFWDYIPVVSPDKGKASIQRNRNLSKETLSLKDSWNNLSDQPEKASRSARKTHCYAESSLVEIWQESGKKLRNISTLSRGSDKKKGDRRNYNKQNFLISERVDKMQGEKGSRETSSDKCVKKSNNVEFSGGNQVDTISETNSVVVNISSDSCDMVDASNPESPVKSRTPQPLSQVSASRNVPRHYSPIKGSVSSDKQGLLSPSQKNCGFVKKVISKSESLHSSQGSRHKANEGVKPVSNDVGSTSPVFKRSPVSKQCSPVFKSAKNKLAFGHESPNSAGSVKERKKPRISKDIRESIRIQTELSMCPSSPVSNDKQFTSPVKTGEAILISSPQSGYSTTPREKRRKQWKRKSCDSALESSDGASVSTEPHVKRRKLDKLKYVINKENDGACSSPKKSTRSPKKSLFNEDVNTSNIQLNSLNSSTRQHTDDSFSLKWQPVTLSEDSKKVKLNSSWTLISDRSASKLLSSEDDKESFNGFTEEEVNADHSSLPSDLSYEEHSEVELHSSEHEWSIEGEASDKNDDEFSKLVPTFSSPGKQSEPDWEVNIDSFMKNRVTDRNLSLTSPWRSPRSTGKKCAINNSTTEKVTPVKNKRPSFFQRISQADNSNVSKPDREKVDDEIEFNHKSPQKWKPDREKVDEEIEFNHKSPQKFRCDFSPLRAENGVILGQVKKNITSTPASSGLKTKTHSDKKFAGLVFSYNDDLDTESKSKSHSPVTDYRLLKKKSDVKKTFNLKYDASPQKKTKKAKT